MLIYLITLAVAVQLPVQLIATVQRGSYLLAAFAMLGTLVLYLQQLYLLRFTVGCA